MDDEHVLEQIDLYAAGALPEETRQEVEAHLRNCARCALEARDAVEAATLLVHALPPRDPPPALRDAVLDAIRREPGPARPRRVVWWRAAGVLAGSLAAVLVLALLTWQTLAVARLEGQVARIRTALVLQERLAGALVGVEAVVIPMQVTSEHVPGARGIVILLPAAEQRPQAEVIVAVAGLPAPQPDGLYQAWLQEGENRISLGVLVIDATGAGVIRYRLTRDPLSYQGIGITYEHGGPAASPKGPRVLLAKFGTPAP